MERHEALRILGLVDDFEPEELRRARRRALLVHHPDHGGSAAALARVEAAASALGAVETTERTVRGVSRTPNHRGAPVTPVRRGVDRPSFTVDVLPVETFELLLLASAELGEVIDDDPPYRLEVKMASPEDTWVLLEVVPDAGGSTVSIAAEGTRGFDMESLRDTWISTINGLSAT